jgi:hypothetical protein
MMKAGKAWAVAAQVAVGSLLVLELAYLVCFFAFLVPPAVRVFESLDMPLPGPMLVVLNVSNIVRHHGAYLVVVAMAAAVGWAAFEVACRSEAKPLIRLAVGGWLVVVLGVVALWFSLVTMATLAQTARRAGDDARLQGRPAIQAPASTELPPDAT